MFFNRFSWATSCLLSATSAIFCPADLNSAGQQMAGQPAELRWNVQLPHARKGTASRHRPFWCPQDVPLDHLDLLEMAQRWPKQIVDSAIKNPITVNSMFKGDGQGDNFAFRSSSLHCRDAQMGSGRPSGNGFVWRSGRPPLRTWREAGWRLRGRNPSEENLCISIDSPFSNFMLPHSRLSVPTVMEAYIWVLWNIACKNTL